jgi:CDP-L-myo-inositol myo-inositolphosphotransferase
MSSPLGYRFSSSRTADRLVAGVPAAARLAKAHAAALPGTPLLLVLGDTGTLAPLTGAEIIRLAPGLVVELRAPANVNLLSGETLPDPARILAVQAGLAAAPYQPADPEMALRDAARAIMRSTAKPGDGIISRHCNRPLSQAASSALLRFGWIRPGHATLLTFLTALAMLASLLTGTTGGLVVGALLFQIASVVDGIDGEIARATFRSSKAGASLDSIIDAFTNVAFLAGAGCNFWMQGRAEDALVGMAAAAVMATGLAILGASAFRREGIVHFDGAKRIQEQTGSPNARLLKDLTSRDFYCFALLVAALAGVLDVALKVFLAAVIVWLVAIISLLSARAPGRE